MNRVNPTAVRAIVMQEATRSMNKAMATLEAEVLRRVPVRTGHLRRSIAFHVEARAGLVVGALGTNVEYAPYLEFGTGLYGPRNRWIVPVHAQVLRFPAGGTPSLFSGGSRQGGTAGPGFTLAGRQRSGDAGGDAQWVFAQRVRGIRPRRMFRDSALIAEPRAMMQFRAGGRRIAARIQELAGK